MERTFSGRPSRASRDRPLGPGRNELDRERLRLREEVFARQIEAQGRAGDLLVAISTSGQSENVLRAVDAARAAGLLTAALTGRTGGKLASRVDVPIVVPLAETADRIQEVHIQILHAVILAAEQRIFPATR